ncbi:MAG: hypothetical protein GY756_17060 [bacterium]|nr:hypothetical protein [bacterium]
MKKNILLLLAILTLITACDKNLTNSNIYQDEYESNNSFTDAFGIEIIKEYEGNFHTYTDKDYYFYQAKAGKEYHIIANVPTGANINLRLYNESESKLLESIDGKDINKYIHYKVLADEKLYISCYPVNSINPNVNYKLQILCGNIPKPNTPVNVNASNNKQNKITITWDKISGVDFYAIEKAPTSSGPWTQLTTTKELEFDDITVIAGNSYFYRVRTYKYLYSDYSSISEGKIIGTASILDNKIAFVSNNEIHIMNIDGSDQKRLTNNISSDITPSISGDGSKIAFCRDNKIYIMNADGSNQVLLTESYNSSVEPSISSDGSKIAFCRNSEIYIMNADGSNQVQLTNNPNPANFIINGSPSISGDGSKIAFSLYRYSDKKYQIYIMNADGSDQRQLTSSDYHDVEPSISNDGSKIVFQTDRHGSYTNNEIYIMDADGSNQKRLTNNTSSDMTPSISSDGSKIVFMADRDRNSEIYIMNADGSSQTRLTNNTIIDKFPFIN